MSKKASKACWQTVKFDDIAQNVAERVDPAEAETDVYVGLEHLDPSTLHLREWGHPSDVTGQKLKFKKGDVIFGRRRAYQRKLAIAESDGICSAHAMVVRAKPKMILPEFLPFFLQSDMFMERAIEISVGSLSPTINWKTLKIQEFPLPLSDEQKRMAEILWAADEARESFAEASRCSRIARSTFFENSQPHDKTRLAKLNDAIEGIVAGKSPSGASRPAEANEYGVLKVSAVGDECYVESENKALLDQSNFNSNFEVQKGFILVTRANANPRGVGRPCMVHATRPGLMLSDKTLRLVPKQSVNARFLYQTLLSSPYRDYVDTSAGVTEAKLKKAPIWLPSTQVQESIAEILARFDESIGQVEDHIAQQAALMKAIQNGCLR